VIAAPSRLDNLKWYIFGGLAALFAMGALLLSTKKIVVPSLDSESGSATPTGKSSASAKTKKSAPDAPPAHAPSNISAQVDQQVAQTMEGLKEQIFRLELRRQAGTISEDDYNHEKSRIDALLRNLVQG
jgi:hypothetical protein